MTTPIRQQDLKILYDIMVGNLIEIFIGTINLINGSKCIIVLKTIFSLNYTNISRTV